MGALLKDREIREKDEEARALNDARRIDELQRKLKVLCLEALAPFSTSLKQ